MMRVDSQRVGKLVVLKEEIRISIAIAQAFLDYKRGDMTFDRFVMDALELSGDSSLSEEADPKHYRDFIEGLRSNTLPHNSSGSALTALLEYDALFDAVMSSNRPTHYLFQEEVDDMWEIGRDYLMSKEKTLVY